MSPDQHCHMALEWHQHLVSIVAALHLNYCRSIQDFQNRGRWFVQFPNPGVAPRKADALPVEKHGSGHRLGFLAALQRMRRDVSVQGLQAVRQCCSLSAANSGGSFGESKWSKWSKHLVEVSSKKPCSHFQSSLNAF